MLPSPQTAIVLQELQAQSSRKHLKQIASIAVMVISISCAAYEAYLSMKRNSVQQENTSHAPEHVYKRSLVKNAGSALQHETEKVKSAGENTAENSARLARLGSSYVETGFASWYGPPFHGRLAANGSFFDMNVPTVAHRTLPLGSLVRVVNLQNGRSIVLPVTDRGPFIPGRILDLSLAAAQQIGMWQAGVAAVRLEVVQAAAPIDKGGRWALQIGGFVSEEEASQVRDETSKNYRVAGVRQFRSPTGRWWLHVRVPGDERARAEELARIAHGNVNRTFLIRLD